MEKRNNVYKFINSIVFIMCICLSFCMPVRAVDAGPDALFNISSCSISNGMQNVPLKTTITISFTKNVADFTVRDRNMGCVSITDQNGAGADFVMRVSDSFDQRRNMYADCNFLPETTYTLQISSNVIAKNMENTLDRSYSYTFTTEKLKEPEPVPEERPLVPPVPGDQDIDGDGNASSGSGEADKGSGEGAGNDKEGNQQNTESSTSDQKDPEENKAEQTEEPEEDPPSLEMKQDVLQDMEALNKTTFKVYSISENFRTKKNGDKGRDGAEAGGMVNVKKLKILFEAAVVLLFITGMTAEAVRYKKARQNNTETDRDSQEESKEKYTD